MNCCICGEIIEADKGHPYHEFHGEHICTSCALGLMPSFLNQKGDGGLMDVLLEEHGYKKSLADTYNDIPRLMDFLYQDCGGFEYDGNAQDRICEVSQKDLLRYIEKRFKSED